MNKHFKIQNIKFETNSVGKFSQQNIRINKNLHGRKNVDVNSVQKKSLPKSKMNARTQTESKPVFQKTNPIIRNNNSSKKSSSSNSFGSSVSSSGEFNLKNDKMKRHEEQKRQRGANARKTATEQSGTFGSFVNEQGKLEFNKSDKQKDLETRKSEKQKDLEKRGIR